MYLRVCVCVTRKVLGYLVSPNVLNRKEARERDLKKNKKRVFGDEEQSFRERRESGALLSFCTKRRLISGEKLSADEYYC
jgi:hypothetical protein